MLDLITFHDKLKEYGVMIESPYAQYALWFFLKGGDAIDPTEAKRFAIKASGLAEKPTASRISRVHNDPRVKEVIDIITKIMTEMLGDENIGLPHLYGRNLKLMDMAISLLEYKLGEMQKDKTQISYQWLKLAGDFFEKICRLSGNAAPEKVDITVNHKLEDYFSDSPRDNRQAAGTLEQYRRH